MKFNPISDADLNEMQEERKSLALSDGEAVFVVINAEDTVSKSGNPMVKIKLKIRQENGATGHMYDWLVGADNCVWKLSSFCKACGKEGEYKKGELDPEEIKGWKGNCLIKIEKTDDYGDQPRLHSYLEKSQVEQDEEDLNDDLPF